MTHEIETSRREFLGAVGAGVAAAGSLTVPAEAATPLKIVDFHNHYMGPSWTSTNLANVPPAARPTWERINGNLQSPERPAGLGRDRRHRGAGDQHADRLHRRCRRQRSRRGAPADQRPDGRTGRQASRQALRSRNRRCILGRCRRARADAGGARARPARRVRGERQGATFCWAPRRRARRSPPRPRSACRCSCIR